MANTRTGRRLLNGMSPAMGTGFSLSSDDLRTRWRRWGALRPRPRLHVGTGIPASLLSKQTVAVAWFNARSARQAGHFSTSWSARSCWQPTLASVGMRLATSRELLQTDTHQLDKMFYALIPLPEFDLNQL